MLRLLSASVPMQATFRVRVVMLLAFSVSASGWRLAGHRRVIAARKNSLCLGAKPHLAVPVKPRANLRCTVLMNDVHDLGQDETIMKSVRHVLQKPRVGEPLSLEAWVHRSQMLGRQLAFIKLGDSDHDGQYLSAMLQQPKKQVRLYAPGSRVLVRGVMEQDDRGWILIVSEAKLLCAAASESSVRRVIRAVNSTGLLTVAEAKSALLLDADADLPPATDRRAVQSILSTLQDMSPTGAMNAAIGARPAPPSAAKDHALAGLLADDVMQRAVASVNALGGATAAAALLRGRLVDASQNRGFVVVKGEVCGRRQLSDGFWVIYLCLDSDVKPMLSTPGPRQSCVMHSSFGGNNILTYALLAAVGSQLHVAGVLSPQGDSSNVLLACGAKLLRASAHSKALHPLLSCVADGSVDALEAMRALPIDIEGTLSQEAAEEAAEAFREELQAESSSERKWRVSTLQRTIASNRAARDPTQVTMDTAKELIDNSQIAESSSVAQVHSALRALYALRARYPLHSLKLHDAEEEPTVGDTVSGVKHHKEQMVGQKQQRPASMRDARPQRRIELTSPTLQQAWERPTGVLSNRSSTFWQAKKRPQVLLMTQIVDDLLNAHPNSTSLGVCMNILDVGGGAGHLAQHLAERFGSRVNVTVVDIRWGRIKVGSKRARLRGALQNLHFVAGDASELLRTGAFGRVDIIVGLHACGALSDVILGDAVVHGAAFAVATCCYMSHRHLKVKGSTGILMARDEWLGVAASFDSLASKNEAIPALRQETLDAALRAAEQQHDPVVSSMGAHTVNAIRARAVEQHWENHWQRHNSHSMAKMPEQSPEPGEFSILIQ